MNAAATPARDRIDDALFEALHRSDGAVRRWAARRAGGLTGRDLRAAIAYELFKVDPRPRPGDAYRVGGCPVAPYLTVPGVDGSSPVEVEGAALAVRARALLRIPVRAVDEPAEVWAVAARGTGVVLYAIDCEEREAAADLMEPEHHGSSKIRFDRAKASAIPAYVEIRRMPMTLVAAEPAAVAPAPAPAMPPEPGPIIDSEHAPVAPAGPTSQPVFDFGDPDWLQEARRPGRRKAVRS